MMLMRLSTRCVAFAARHLDAQRRSNHNKAAYAHANKLARICFATLRDKTPFGDTARLNRKLTRESFVMPA